MRYFDKIKRVEFFLIEGVPNPPEVEFLPDNNVFWFPIPEGKFIQYVDDLPHSYGDLPVESDRDNAVLSAEQLRVSKEAGGVIFEGTEYDSGLQPKTNVDILVDNIVSGFVINDLDPTQVELLQDVMDLLLETAGQAYTDDLILINDLVDFTLPNLNAIATPFVSGA